MNVLRDLALANLTDKAGGRDNPDNHEYCEAYEFFLSPLRDVQFSMLELGVGGYEFPDRGGQSLRMWSQYFTQAEIFALDKFEKKLAWPARVRVYEGDQTDKNVLSHIFSSMRYKCRLIIDDASHINPLTLETFRICWPYLAPGGIYVVEDVHASYWTEHGFQGGHHPWTVMNFFKSVTDDLNKKHSGMPPIPYCHDVESVHFFEEIIFIRKKK
jgi:hypothetical protein